MARTLARAHRLRGEIKVPPDKSISHRAAILGALATGESLFQNFLTGADCLSTISCLRALGVAISLNDQGELRVTGRGAEALREPRDVLDCGNSGTTMRLLSGVLAARSFRSVLTGDDSLRSRPMRRIADPLNQMGADIETTSAGTAPLTIAGGALQPIAYESPVASAQVKSAILLAGVQTDGDTTVTEPYRSRDHTERMLSAMGAGLTVRGATVTVSHAPTLAPLAMRIPGDMSSAAAWITVAVCHPDAELLLTGVGVNPTRTGLVEILRRMGADIELLEERVQAGEPVADLRVSSSRLTAASVTARMVPSALDELPLVALAATQAAGRTVVSGAAELMVKESDRAAETAAILRQMGADIESTSDGWVIQGPTRLQGT
ncbi:MAG TPA: 3-phosphoshikimate 1-carboxyvinyltransferase, partial [Dehalococcoidia bacterium]|nr:3-phosphoshikimate 1-carboxyvinyltransferase [Dehalococcoidia bacterium]